MIAVDLYLNSFLRDQLPDGASLHRFFDSPVSVGELIFQLGLPPRAVAMAAVNGSRVEFDHLLADGDQVVLLPQAGGG